MNQWKRVLVFLILNVVVSAATTLLVLAAWNHAHPGMAAVAIPTSAVTLQAGSQGGNSALTPLPSGETGSTPLPPDQAAVVIDSILAPGSLNDETVLIKSHSNGSVLLTNWRLEDGHGDVYTFPDLTLNKNGAVQVHTGAGTNTVIDLYWGLNNPVWKSGDTATLLDNQGKQRATYKIP